MWQEATIPVMRVKRASLSGVTLKDTSSRIMRLDITGALFLKRHKTDFLFQIQSERDKSQGHDVVYYSLEVKI